MTALKSAVLTRSTLETNRQLVTVVKMAIEKAEAAKRVAFESRYLSTYTWWGFIASTCFRPESGESSGSGEMHHVGKGDRSGSVMYPRPRHLIRHKVRMTCIRHLRVFYHILGRSGYH
jgi:hypothetical protein